MYNNHTHPSTDPQGMFSPSSKCHQTTPRKCQEYSPVTQTAENVIWTHLQAYVLCNEMLTYI